MNRLTVNKDLLWLMDGDNPFMVNGCLMWGLYGFYLDQGEAKLREVLDDRKNIGFNTVTVLSMWSRWKNFHPSFYGQTYWDGWRIFLDILASYEMRCIITVLADTKPTSEWIDTEGDWPGMPNLQDQKDHWKRLIVTVGDKDNVMFVVANQPGHSSQTIKPIHTIEFDVPQVGDFPKMLFARNNPMEAANPVLPAGDFSCACTKRREPFAYAEIGFSMHTYVHGNVSGTWTGTKQPTILLEPYKIEKSWTLDPGKAKVLARQTGAAKGSGGGNIWTHNDRMCVPYSGLERLCAIEFSNAMARTPV